VHTFVSTREKHFYEFGPFRLDMTEGQLWRGSEEISLTPKASAVLLLLVRNSGHTLTKEDFMGEVWAGSFVEEKNLADNISILRQALGDDAKSQKYIRTIPRRGYRFVSDVHEIKDDPIEIVMHETARAHIVVDEEHEEPLADIVLAHQDSFRDQTSAVALLPQSRARWWSHPAFIVAACALIAGLGFAAYRFLSSKPAPSATERVPAGTISAKTIAVLPFKSLVAGSQDPVYATTRATLSYCGALISDVSLAMRLTLIGGKLACCNEWGSQNTNWFKRSC
jgi:DNA-binding winged helix-turn-helix (wHTH) protein